MTRQENWQNTRRWNASAKSRNVRERVFVNSMSDTFDDWRGQVVDAGCLETLDEVREHLWSLIEECTALDFLLLTKRPENIARMVPPRWLHNAYCPTCGYEGCIAGDDGRHARCGTPLEMWPTNVWIGITAEDQAALEQRIGYLVGLPAPVRFISHEPAIGPLDFKIDLEATTNRFGLMTCPKCRGWGAFRASGHDVSGEPVERDCWVCAGTGTGVDWVISGGESGRGPKIRPCAMEWLLRDKEQCRAASAAWFCKQLGSYVVSEERAAGSQEELDELGGGLVFPQDRWLWRMGTKDWKGEDIEEFPEHMRVREIPLYS